MSHYHSIIIDMDNTLANARWRTDLIEESWDAFHLASAKDVPFLCVKKLLEACRESFNLVVVTGRPEKWRLVSSNWLRLNGIETDLILMRGEDDYRPVPEVKLGILETHFGSLEQAADRIIFALEDHDETIEAFRENGIVTFQVRQGGIG